MWLFILQTAPSNCGTPLALSLPSAPAFLPETTDKEVYAMEIKSLAIVLALAAGLIMVIGQLALMIVI